MHPYVMEELVRQRERELRKKAERCGSLVHRTRRGRLAGQRHNPDWIQLARTSPTSRLHTGDGGPGAA